MYCAIVFEVVCGDLGMVCGISMDRYVGTPLCFSVFLCPATKSGGVLCYTLRTFECLSSAVDNSFVDGVQYTSCW